MYIDHITIKNFRTFRNTAIEFIHPDQDFDRLGLTPPPLRNVNLLLGNNGFGKTTLLKAIALACLGPAVGRVGLYPYRLVRTEPESSGPTASRGGRLGPEWEGRAAIDAAFTPHAQDGLGGLPLLLSQVEVRRMGDLEDLVWTGHDDDFWQPIFSEHSDALFFVGYGATRRVEEKQRYDAGARSSRAFARAQRVQSLFRDDHSLIPLNAWLPQYQARNRGRYAQVVGLMNDLLGPGHYEFTGEMEGGEYLFVRQGLRVPFPALSDGYRAFIGWVADLLHHVCMTCPSGKKLVENQGIVMVDEIDLHLHPKWQMTALPTLARALPNVQFIVTSHSPLIVGSLQWQNIITMRPVSRQATELARIESPVHGLDADQVLLTEFFGLQSTRAPGPERQLKSLTLKAREGDSDAALAVLRAMTKGAEQA
ncbi:AAA family ATPase [Roseateles sp.]|uniref:AAA family ATPase n=1 Tax=Roseateles sp. TaxID=1971397 RepID=UPI0031DE8DC8